MRRRKNQKYSSGVRPVGCFMWAQLGGGVTGHVYLQGDTDRSFLRVPGFLRISRAYDSFGSQFILSKKDFVVAAARLLSFSIPRQMLSIRQADQNPSARSVTPPVWMFQRTPPYTVLRKNWAKSGFARAPSRTARQNPPRISWSRGSRLPRRFIEDNISSLELSLQIFWGTPVEIYDVKEQNGPDLPHEVEIEARGVPAADG